MQSNLIILGLILISSPTWAQFENVPTLANTAPTVTIRGDTLSVRIVGRRVSALQPLERQMTLRATELLAQHMCRYKPEPNKRLATSLKGVQVVHSVESSGALDLVVEVPMQSPICEVVSATPWPTKLPDVREVDPHAQKGFNIATLPTESNSGTGPTSIPSPASTTQPKVREAPIVVIDNKGEI